MDIRRLTSLTRKACQDYDLISDGDKIAVGVSGGKDSLTLLYAMHYMQRFYPKKYELCAITVDLGLDNFVLEPVQKLCEELGIEYRVIKTQIGDILFEARKETNPCALCAKLRKGALNDAAKEMGVTAIAYAHHSDDLIETMLLSLIYEGRFYAFPPKATLSRTGLKVIRPMIYVSEADVIGFKNAMNLPVAKNPCPYDGKTKREYVKKLTKHLNIDAPGVKSRFFHAIVEGNIEGWPEKVKYTRTKSTRTNESSVQLDQN